MRFSYLHDPCQSIHIRKSYPILFYHLKNLLYQLYNTILQYTQHLNFYFSILLIKIIYLHNKIYIFFSQFSPPHAYVSSRLLHTFTFHILLDSSIPLSSIFIFVFYFFVFSHSFFFHLHLFRLTIIFLSFFSFFVLLSGSHSPSIPNQQLVTPSISGSHKLTSFLNLQHHTSTAQSPPLCLHHAHQNPIGTKTIFK